MKRDPGQLAGRELDLLVIGGGVSGAAIAWDATLRGLSVGVVEKGDFGAATSAASSKIIHGGIRLLQQGRIDKVVESVREQTAFLTIAPHLVRPLPFLVPTYGHGLRGPELLTAGMTVYEAFAAFGRRDGPDPDARIPRFRVLRAGEVRELAPEVPAEGLTGGVLYHDAQMTSPERTTLAFLVGAAERGALVANYVEARGFLLEGDQVVGARCVDRESGDACDVRARLTLNVTGPWAFHTAAALFGREVEARVRFSKGIHLVLPGRHTDVALALATRMQSEAIVSRGGRHVFLIPWRGRTLAGTTNVPFEGEPDDLRVTESDVTGFLDEIRSACPAAAPSRDEVLHAYGGLYPLIDVKVRSGVYQGSAEYRIYDHERLHGKEGLVTVIGAKYTTARRLAEKAVSLALAKLGRPAVPCRTRSELLPGGDVGRMTDFLAAARERHGRRLGTAALDELVRHTGSRYVEVIALADADPALAGPISDTRPVPKAWIVHVARSEQARTLADVVFRRTGIATLGNPGEACLRACAQLLGDELGWDARRREQEAGEVSARFEGFAARP